MNPVRGGEQDTGISSAATSLEGDFTTPLGVAGHPLRPKTVYCELRRYGTEFLDETQGAFPDNSIEVKLAVRSRESYKLKDLAH